MGGTHAGKKEGSPLLKDGFEQCEIARRCPLDISEHICG